MKTADSPAGKILGSAEALKLIQECPYCYVDILCVWLIQLSVQIRWFLALRTAVSSLAVKGDWLYGQVSMCGVNYINMLLLGMQLGEAAFEY